MRVTPLLVVAITCILCYLLYKPDSLNVQSVSDVEQFHSSGMKIQVQHQSVFGTAARIEINTRGVELSNSTLPSVVGITSPDSADNSKDYFSLQETLEYHEKYHQLLTKASFSTPRHAPAHVHYLAANDKFKPAPSIFNRAWSRQIFSNMDRIISDYVFHMVVSSDAPLAQLYSSMKSIQTIYPKRAIFLHLPIALDFTIPVLTLLFGDVSNVALYLEQENRGSFIQAVQSSFPQYPLSQHVVLTAHTSLNGPIQAISNPSNQPLLYHHGNGMQRQYTFGQVQVGAYTGQPFTRTQSDFAEYKEGIKYRASLSNPMCCANVLISSAMGVSPLDFPMPVVSTKTEGYPAGSKADLGASAEIGAGKGYSTFCLLMSKVRATVKYAFDHHSSSGISKDQCIHLDEDYTSKYTFVPTILDDRATSAFHSFFEDKLTKLTGKFIESVFFTSRTDLAHHTALPLAKIKYDKGVKCIASTDYEKLFHIHTIPTSFSHTLLAKGWGKHPGYDVFVRKLQAAIVKMDVSLPGCKALILPSQLPFADHTLYTHTKTKTPELPSKVVKLGFLIPTRADTENSDFTVTPFLKHFFLQIRDSVKESIAAYRDYFEGNRLLKPMFTAPFAFEVIVYLGCDKKDTVFSSPEVAGRMLTHLHKIVGDQPISIKQVLLNEDYKASPNWIWNDLSRFAYDDDADYMFQFKDNVDWRRKEDFHLPEDQVTSKNWVLGTLKAFTEMPLSNFGIAGPQNVQSRHILTQVIFHRSRMESLNAYTDYYYRNQRGEDFSSFCIRDPAAVKTLDFELRSNQRHDVAHTSFDLLNERIDLAQNFLQTYLQRKAPAYAEKYKLVAKQVLPLFNLPYQPIDLRPL